MPEIIKKELTKRYYNIGEVAEMFDVSKSLIRYWEQEFEILKPRKTASGERKFTPENVTQFLQIFQLVKERGFTLNGAKIELQKIKKEERKKLKMIRSLKEIKNLLLDLKDRV